MRVSSMPATHTAFGAYAEVDNAVVAAVVGDVALAARLRVRVHV